MGFVDSPEIRKRRGKGRWRSRRSGFHLDMTPMVDVAFLLLTFFMLTTTFAKSNTMEIMMPPVNSELKVEESNVLTLRISGDDMAYCSHGRIPPRPFHLYNFAHARPYTLSTELRQFLRREIESNSKMVVVVRISDKARYHNLVDIIDELNMMKLERFTLDDFTDQDVLAIQHAG